jgi:exosortase/archaeosortase family protein
MLTGQVKEKNPNSKNKLIKIFFLKLIALATIWELSYNFVLKPLRIPGKFLTDTITAGVVACINLFSPASSHVDWVDDGPQSVAAFIKHGGRGVFYIADVCNALDLMVIYLGFIILLPGSFKRKLIFSVAGIIGLIISNIIRCTSLYWIALDHPSLFDISHHYTFTILMYLLIFSGWLLFIKGSRKNEVH